MRFAWSPALPPFRGVIAATILVALVTSAAAQEIKATPTQLDRLKADDIPAAERFDWQPKELVAVYGSHAWRYWTNPYWVAPDLRTHLTTDGKRVTVLAWNAPYGGLGDTLRVWDAGTGKDLKVFRGPPAHGVGFSARGSLVALCRDTGVDWALTIRDVATGKVRHQQKLKGEVPGQVTFSPSGKLVALERGHLEILDPATGKQLMTKTYAGGAAFHPAGRLVFCGRDAFIDDDKTEQPARFYELDLATRKERTIYEVRGLHNALHPTLSPDGRWLAIGLHRSEDIRLWDVARGKAGRLIKVAGGAVSAAFSPDSRALACGLTDRRVRLYDVATGEERLTLGEPQPGLLVSRPTFSPDGKALAATCQGDSSVLLWDTTTGKETGGPGESITILAAAPDSGTLLVGTRVDGRYGSIHWHDGLVLRDVATGRTRPVKLPVNQMARQAAFSPDGRTLAVLAQVPGHTAMLLYDARTGQALPGGDPLAGATSEIRYSADGKTLVAVAGPGVTFYDTATWKVRGSLTGTWKHTGGMGMTADGTLFVLSTDEDIKLIDVGKAAVTSFLPAPGFARPLAVSPDGTKVALAHDGVNVKVWTVKTQELLYDLKGHQGYLVDLAFDREGASIFTAGSDGRLLRWFSADAKTEWRLPGPVQSVRRSPDGRHLLVNNGNRTAYVLRIGELPD